MAVISGIGGSVTYASGYTTAVRSWSVSLTADTLETTGLAPANNFRSRIQGLKSWSGSYSAYVDSSTFLTMDDGVGNAAAAAVFLFDGTTGNMAGDIIVTDMSVTTNTDGAIEVEFSFEGSGQVVIGA